MRQRASIKIDNLEYTIKELKMKEIIALLMDKKFDDEKPKTEKTDPNKPKAPVDLEKSLFGIGPFLDRLISISFENNVKREDLFEHTPSELKLLYNAFREVNGPFFEVAQYLNLGGTLHEITKKLLETFSNSAVTSSKPVIHRSLTTVTPTL